MNLSQRIKNVWFLSGISKKDIEENPNSFMTKYINAQEYQGKAYIAGLSEEEQSFADTLNSNGKDTILV